jgi:hypothetical protein
MLYGLPPNGFLVTTVTTREGKLVFRRNLRVREPESYSWLGKAVYFTFNWLYSRAAIGHAWLQTKRGTDCSIDVSYRDPENDRVLMWMGRMHVEDGKFYPEPAPWLIGGGEAS